jgi:hypothetical protein
MFAKSMWVIQLCAAAVILLWQDGLGAVDRSPATTPAPSTAASPAPQPANQKQWTEAEVIKELGAWKGKPVDAGFVFVDGRYVEAPYTVSRQGVGIFVNDTRLRDRAVWPPVDYEDEDPGMPPGLTRDSTFDDLNIPGDRWGDTWDRKKVRWIERHFNREEARERIIEYYRSLPFIKDVRDGERCPTDIILETFSGKKVTMDVSPPYFPPTKAQVVATMDRYCANLEERLGKGDCFFLFSRAGEISFGQHKAAKDLGLMVEILTSERTAEEKKDLLQRMAIMPSGGVTGFDSLVRQFKGSPALNARIERLVQEMGVTPTRLEDVPSEAPFTKRAREMRERLLQKEAQKKSAATDEKDEATELKR